MPVNLGHRFMQVNLRVETRNILSSLHILHMLSSCKHFQLVARDVSTAGVSLDHGYRWNLYSNLALRHTCVLLFVCSVSI